MNFFQIAPDGAKALNAVEQAISGSGIDHGLLELVRLRASQVNGCAFCINMHVTGALKNGESHERLHLLSAWRDSPLFTERERAALNWTEVLTDVSRTHAPEADFLYLKVHFEDQEIAYLTLAISSINVWNRIQIGLHARRSTGQVAAAA
ncbi:MULTISPECIES: carboxymuconolactone decarboxylase family protein [Sphingomonas]|nr:MULTISPECIES: carboxymuconolactone decarboxylase family protein [Sphingomonas]